MVPRELLPALWAREVSIPYRIAGIGHRPETLPDGADVPSILREVAKFIDSACHDAMADGRNVEIVCGGQRGGDLWIAEAGVRVGCIVRLRLPFPPELFTAKWSQDDRDRLEWMIAHSEGTWSVVRNDYHVSAYHVRDRQVVDESDIVYAIHDGRNDGGTASTIKYAKKRGKRVHVLHPVTLITEVL